MKKQFFTMICMMAMAAAVLDGQLAMSAATPKTTEPAATVTAGRYEGKSVGTSSSGLSVDACYMYKVSTVEDVRNRADVIVRCRIGEVLEDLQFGIVRKAEILSSTADVGLYIELNQMKNSSMLTEGEEVVLALLSYGDSSRRYSILGGRDGLFSAGDNTVYGGKLELAQEVAAAINAVPEANPGKSLSEKIFDVLCG